MAKKEIKTTKTVQEVKPDFYVQISKGSIGVTLSKTDDKLKVNFDGVNAIDKIDMLHDFVGLLGNVIESYYENVNEEDCCEEDCVGPCYAN
jgi:hypothetical protein